MNDVTIALMITETIFVFDIVMIDYAHSFNILFILFDVRICACITSNYLDIHLLLLLFTQRMTRGFNPSIQPSFTVVIHRAIDRNRMFKCFADPQFSISA
eukprot:70241_1